MSIADVLGRLEGVRRSGSGYIARCPSHPDRRPSLSIRESEDGRVLLKCFAGCSFAAIRDDLGLRSTERDTCWSRTPPSPRNLNAADRAKFARRIWRESQAAAGTIAESYLRVRGITIQPPVSIRFHPHVRHPTGIHAPAMVAAVQNCAREIVGVHRTFLRTDGSAKANLDPQKMALGAIAGGAVRLAKPAETLALAEGVETALSVLQATGIPIWATLGTANLVRIEVPDPVRQIILCADADAAGEAAARTVAVRLAAEGRNVNIARPPAGKDFNDLLMEEV